MGNALRRYKVLPARTGARSFFRKAKAFKAPLCNHTGHHRIRYSPPQICRGQPFPRRMGDVVLYILLTKIQSQLHTSVLALTPAELHGCESGSQELG